MTDIHSGTVVSTVPGRASCAVCLLQPLVFASGAVRAKKTIRLWLSSLSCGDLWIRSDLAEIKVSQGWLFLEALLRSS